MALGDFSHIEAQDEHASGHKVYLWHEGSKIFGFLWYWDGSIKGSRGLMQNGKINLKTGELSFFIEIKGRFVRHEQNQPSHERATFKGTLKDNSLTGSLDWYDILNDEPGMQGTQNITLNKKEPKYAHNVLKDFLNHEEWKTQYNYLIK